ncbi:HlyD family efflux transporter periplasmic adaptor subunit [Kovacikia minuta CCNUW1]|uniref:HlyD family secretion protein n=1 Tax=Kovacikia minuta TaxID=2931930 RepID=UPI001CCEBA44|nr:HlyD family efflux transporter periplasmic adaptor subunit [Kovacikia minuta]UBF24068.1 HlyD family efflux transporter periplasmic adaptor subunit [Kovacikia minuta CCNUW1]
MTQSIPSSAEGASDTPVLESKHRRKPNPRILIGGGIVALVAIGTAIWYFLGRPINADLEVSGRIEGYETDIGAKTGGRVDFIAVREGDAVKRGQLLVRINDDEVQAQLQGAAARVAAAQKQAQQAQLQIAVIENQMRESELNVLQSQQDNQGRVYQAQSNQATAEAQLKQTQSQLRLAKIDRDRYSQLLKEGAVTQQQFDQAQTNYETALATVESTQKQVDAARGALALAQSSSFNPAIRGSQLSALNQQRKQAYAQLQAAQADIKNALAAQQQIQAQITYLNIASPIDGVVTARSVEPGAVVATGKTVLSLINLNTVYLRGFIPEGEIGRVRVGQQAKVFLDSDPDHQQPLNAKVVAIDPQASFTPENIYFRDDRVRQVFGVKLAIDNPAGFAKPGMPADGEIILQ